MFREHGRPELLREEAALDELAVRVQSFRRRVLIAVIFASFIVAGAVTLAVGGLAEGPLRAPRSTGKFLGYVFAIGLFGTMFGAHRIGNRLVLRGAERWARELSESRRCDLEPLLEAARLFSGGKSD